MRDGTFGTTGECPPLPDDVVEAVEAHNFDPLDVLCWRNDELDFNGIDALLDSLTAPPPRAGLVKGNDASDQETLVALARDPDIRAMAQGRKAIKLLWEACQIPDFRKLTDETPHAACAPASSATSSRTGIYRPTGSPARSLRSTAPRAISTP